jgi:hypothetical protein
MRIRENILCQHVKLMPSQNSNYVIKCIQKHKQWNCMSIIPLFQNHVVSTKFVICVFIMVAIILSRSNSNMFQIHKEILMHTNLPCLLCLLLSTLYVLSNMRIRENILCQHVKLMPSQNSNYVIKCIQKHKQWNC